MTKYFSWSPCEFGGKEYCFMQEHISTHDLFGNFLDHTRELGRFMLPIILKQSGYNPNATPDPNNPAEFGPQTIASQIESVKTKYEWEWDQIRPQLTQWFKEGLGKTAILQHGLEPKSTMLRDGMPS